MARSTAEDKMSRIGKGDLAVKRKPLRTDQQSNKLRWRSVLPKELQQITLSEYRKMDICCPGCCGTTDAKCDVCDGCGYVCPVCTGWPRKLKHYLPTGAILTDPCLTCGYDASSGWEYSADRELAAVERYLDDWVNGRATSRFVTHQKEIEAARAESEAARRERRVWKAG